MGSKNKTDVVKYLTVAIIDALFLTFFKKKIKSEFLVNLLRDA